MNTNPIETVANSSDISKMVFKALSDKQRARRATDLTHLFKVVIKMDQSVPERDFLAVFKQLQDAKVGSLIIGRKNNHNRFLWNYNLKDVAQAAKGKAVEMKTIEESFPGNKKTTRKVKPIIRRKKMRIVKPAMLRQALLNNKIEEPRQTVIPAARTSTLKGPRIQFNLELGPDVPFKDIQALLELVKGLQAK